MSGWRPSRAIARAFLSLAATAAALLIAEAVVRLTAAEPSMLMVKDAVVGQKYRPGAEASPYDDEAHRHVPVRINSLGFRDREHSPQAPTGTRRVLMLGDSFTAGLSVDFEKTFSPLCEERLNATDRGRWEVIEVGVAGYGTAQELLAYEMYGRPFKPAVVVLNFFAGNDVSDNSAELSTSPRPYFKLVDGRLVKEPRSEARQRIAGWLNEHSWLYTWQKRQVQKIEQYVKRSVVVNPVDRVFTAEPDEELERAWAVTEALILRLRADVAGDGGTLLVSYIPFSDEVNRDWWDETVRESPPLQRHRWDLAAPARRLADFCATNGIAFASPRQLFIDRARGERDYFKHGHFNERGHAAYAVFLAEKISSLVR